MTSARALACVQQPARGAEFVLREVSDAGLLPEIYRLRLEAWRAFALVQLDGDGWSDPVDEQALHWAITRDSRLVAAARLSVHETVDDLPDAAAYTGVLEDVPRPIGSINRCVVHPDFRGLGLSTTLDTARIAAARLGGCRSLVVTATHKQRVSQLHSYGFRKIGVGGAYSSGPLRGVRPTVMLMALRRDF